MRYWFLLVPIGSYWRFLLHRNDEILRSSVFSQTWKWNLAAKVSSTSTPCTQIPWMSRWRRAWEMSCQWRILEELQVNKKTCDKPGYWDVSWFRVAKPRSTSITSSSTVSSILAWCRMPDVSSNLWESKFLSIRLSNFILGCIYGPIWTIWMYLENCTKIQAIKVMWYKHFISFHHDHPLPKRCHNWFGLQLLLLLQLLQLQLEPWHRFHHHLYFQRFNDIQ